MHEVDPRSELSSKYEAISRRFLESYSEQDLYHASLLGRDLLQAEQSPTEIVQLHFDTMDKIFKEEKVERYQTIANRLRVVLMEVLMVYGASHQQVRDVLVELQQRYTDLDRTRRELEESQDDLKEKTAQLIQTGKMNALGELVAGVTHEINQPLNAMKIICEDILRDVRKDRLEESTLENSLEEVIQEMRKLSGIVNHMRIFARKTTETQRETLDINQPIIAVLSLIGQQLMHAGIQVVEELSPGLRAAGDPIQLEQVIMNLIINSRDAVAGNKSEMNILIRTCRVQEEGDGRAFVMIQVRDNGCGISKDMLKKVFEPFVTSKKAGEGTGLGLSLTKQIICEHTGRIEVDSEEGIGTTFTVYLPAIASPSQ